MPQAAWPYGDRGGRGAWRHAQGAVRSVERPYRGFAGYGHQAGKSVRQHGRYLAAEANATRPVGSAPTRRHDQSQQAVRRGSTLLNVMLGYGSGQRWSANRVIRALVRP